MKTLLINPPYSEFVYSNRKNAASLDAPLSISYIAAVLEKNKFSVELLDANALNLDIEKTAQIVKGSGADIIGITSSTTIMPVTYKLAKKIKESSPGKIIVVGGPHVTFMPERSTRADPSSPPTIRNMTKPKETIAAKNIPRSTIFPNLFILSAPPGP